MAAALTNGMLSRTVRQKTEPRLRTVKTCSTLVTAMTKKHMVCPTPKPAATAPGSSTKRPSQNASRPTAENATVCCSVARTTSGEKKLICGQCGRRGALVGGVLGQVQARDAVSQHVGEQQHDRRERRAPARELGSQHDHNLGQVARHQEVHGALDV